MRTLVIALLLVVPAANAAELQATKATKAASEAELRANPIRKIITMLQMMVNKIEAEGKKETELFEKYMCYCETSDATLGKSIEEATTKIPQLEADIKVAVETKTTLDGEIKLHYSDREAAKEAMDKAT